MIKKILTYLILILLTFFVYSVSYGQKYDDAEIKTVFIYQFGLNIKWKNENQIEKFKIALYGRDNLILTYLKKLAQNKTLKGKPIEILQTDNIRELIKINPQIVYVSESMNYELITLINRINTKNILVISDNSELQKLFMINFIYSENKTIGFEINKKNIIEQNLEILPKLLLLGGSEIDVKELYKEQEQKLKEEKRKVEILSAKLKNQKKLIDELNIEIEEKLSELKNQKNKITVQYIKIKDQKKALLVVENNIETQNILLLSKINELRIKQSEISEKEAYIEKQNIEVKKGNKLLENLTLKINQEQKKIGSQEKQLDNQELKISKQQNLLIATFLIVFIILILSVLLIKNIRSKQKINKELIFTNIEIVKKNKQILGQTNELKKHRNQLELLVKERTAELQKAKEKAEESDRLKSAFLANMSHEIRTPMNAIIGFSNLLNKNDFTKKKRKELISFIIRGSESLLGLINDIIDISKIEAGQLIIKKNECFLNEIFDNLTIFYSEKMKLYENIKLNIVKNKDENVLFLTDKLRLQQVFINLIDNALKFTEKGSIEVGYNQHISSLGNEIIFYVKDTGIGISEDEQTDIFDRFTKLENENDKLYRGAGLGLSISKNIVELLGGKIWVNSEINKGTTFYFKIPVKNF